jgi:hypothetical protein
MKPEAMTLLYWSAMVDRAKASGADRVEAARDVLVNFAEQVEAVRLFNNPEANWDGPIPWVGADYLATCFRSILAGTDPALALNLIGATRGRRKGNTTHDLEALAAAYFLLTRLGFKPESARAELQKEFGADRTTIQRACKEYRAFRDVRRFDDEILRVSFQDHSRKVNAILKRRKK